ncbi:hypothetical protein HHL16_23755 [Pseudoflavitalea sp. G-6-1-2]|uniref:hypothetical protein n=1 Tax=Pseudoflavitalea sp. G-6-1-2 TaxID=2728841 RepID=UPI00146CBFB2|nr:hypothetical protein [Pseudoflavitalea sp. G-6-1-2]NML23917.1 hypothetical protein [Pseudoflavitalea sp. G-6-1-2]
MAIQTGKTKFSGNLGGDLIGYYRNGKHCLRSMPEHVAQTESTRNAAKAFGDASHTGKLIRQALAPYLKGKKDGSHVNRLNKKLIEEGVEGLRGFRFNQQTRIANFVSSHILDTDNILRIRYILPPRLLRVTHMEIKLIAMRIDLATGKVNNLREHAFTHEFTAKNEDKPLETPLVWNANVPGKGTLMVVLQANPYQGKYPLYDKRFHCTEIIKVEVPPIDTLSKKQRRQLRYKQRQQQQQKQQVKQPASNAVLAQYSRQSDSEESMQQIPDAIRNGLSHDTRLKEQRE